MKTEIRFNFRLLPFIILLLLAVNLVESTPVWKFLLFAFSGAWLCSYIWARALQKGLSLQREMRFGWAQVGDRLEERFTLQNDSSFQACWVEVIDHSTIPGYHVSQVTGVEAKSRQRWRTAGLCQQRGVFTLGPTSLHSSDPLGLFTVSIHDPASVSLLVTPPVLPLPHIQIAPGGRSGEGQPRANAPERTVSAASVRDYIPGDSLRLIHWPTTARRGSPFVRIFDGTPAGDWWIVLDLAVEAQAGMGRVSTLEYAIVLAASLADAGLRQGRSVGLVANSEPPLWLPPVDGEFRRWEILRALALAQPGHIPLEKLLATSEAGLGAQSSLVIITPSLEPKWLEAMLPLIWRGARPTVLLLDPVSFGGEQSGEPLAALLQRRGIPSYLLTPQLLDIPEAQPGQAGQWEWRVSATGRALPLRKPSDVTWRPLV